MMSRDREGIFVGRSKFRSDQATNTAMVATINFAINNPRPNMLVDRFKLLISVANGAPIESSQRVLSIGAKFTTELNNLNMLTSMSGFRLFVAKLMVATFAVFVGWSLRKCDLPTNVASLSRDMTILFWQGSMSQKTIISYLVREVTL